MPTPRTAKFLASTAGQLLLGAILGAGIVVYRVRHGADVSFHSLHDFVSGLIQRGFPPGILISIGMFVAFSLYWEAAAKKASAAKTSESKSSRRFHLVLVSLAQILVLGPIPGLRARFLPDSRPIVIAALIAEFAFFLLAIWARQYLGRHWSAEVTTKVDHELIRSGPYRLVRHPIYTAMLGVYLSVAFVSGEVHGLVGTVVACLAYWRKIRMEEQYLGDLFGEDYARYRSQTPALIPGLL